jgi:hypothetical protein
MPQDTNGCTVAHVLVVFDLMKMWDMVGIQLSALLNLIKNCILHAFFTLTQVVECGAAINIENKAGLTPLTLAAYLARYTHPSAAYLARYTHP